ncbi:hypothetical protein BDZ89DRAFT_958581 [Hymenopellis radicata]|nr:hypothetical protein BDZ89DRAFT_958581 [Hymenopellis radicata]
MLTYCGLVIAPIYNLCTLIVVWLSLKAGCSRDAANTVLKAMRFMIITMLTVIQTSLASKGVYVKFSTRNVDIPTDIRTVYTRLSLEPSLDRVICCSACFKLYLDASTVPQYCQWRRSSRARKCNTLLVQSRVTHDGPKFIPQSLTPIQPFESWLRFFLSRPIIEDALHQTFASFHNAPNVDRMRSTHDSPMWRSFRDYLQSAYSLIFGLYIDWYNPFSNKIAGKVNSCGAIVLFCLNLPLSLQFLPENVFTFTITPGPQAPDLWTIRHIIERLVQMILLMSPPGRLLPTSRHEAGVRVTTRGGPVVADLQAARKVAGQLSHSAGMFCGYCNCHHDDIEELDCRRWRLRNGATVRIQAEQWERLPTLKEKEALAKQTGVRWTPLYMLPYWNPVDYMILGFMHNFLEGNLQFQLRVLWGIGRTKEALARLTQLNADDSTSQFSENQSNASSSRAPSERHSQSGLTDNMDFMDVDLDVPIAAQEDGSRTPTQGSFFPDDDDEDDLQYLPSDIASAFTFRKDHLSAVRLCLQDVLLPTWVQRPPCNLGEKSHGKLKAHELLILFSTIFPLIIPELWSRGTQHEIGMLSSFCDLVRSTHFVSSYSTSNDDADSYTTCYVRYRQSLSQLFPGFKSTPNHHYAMHNGDLMKLWGPLPFLSEFFGERLNGDLARFKKNQRNQDMELTMLRQMCRRSRLDAYLQDRSTQDPMIQEFTSILAQDKVSLHESNDPLNSAQIAKILSEGESLDGNHYTLLLQYLNSSEELYQSAMQTIPQPRGTRILPTAAKSLRHVIFDNRTYSLHAVKEGNSHIQFYIPGDPVQRVETGRIERIWQLPLETMRTFFLVRQHHALTPAQSQFSPFSFEPCTHLQAKLVNADPGLYIHIIEPKHVITHLVVYKRPRGAYRIPADTLAISWALNRDENRADII